MPALQGSRTISGAVTPTTNDDGWSLRVTANATVTLTNSGWTVGRSGMFFPVTGSASVTFVAGASVTVRNVAGDLVLGRQYDGATALYTGTNEWTIYGSEDPQIPAGYVTGAMMQDATIGAAKLGTFAVTSPKIADLAVTTGKLADGAVTLAKQANVTGPTALGRVSGTGPPQALTPTQMRAAAQVAGPVFDVETYGATPGIDTSGATLAANVTAIQAAIDAAEAAGGGIVYFPALYNVDSHVTVDSPGVVLQGSTMNFDVGIRQTVGTADIVRWNAARLGGIERFSLRYAAQATGGVALRFNGLCSSNAFRDLYIWQAHTGIGTPISGAANPTGLFSNSFDNIRIQVTGAARSFINIVGTNAQGTGNAWSNVYCNGGDTLQANTFAMSSYGVYIRQHNDIFSQLNIEWGNYNSAANFPLLVHGCVVDITNLHLEGNTLVTGGALVSTFGANPVTGLHVRTLTALSTKATSGTVAILEPGASNTVEVDVIHLPAGGTATAATFNAVSGDGDNAATLTRIGVIRDPTPRLATVFAASYTAPRIGPNAGASAAYTATNVTTDRAFDANSTTLDELADVVGTLIADLRAAGIVL